MADLKISQLTAVSEVQGTDVFPTVSGLATMKASAAQIKTYVTGSLDANDSAVAGSYVTAVSEADGVISVTREAADVKPTANSTKLLTSGGAKAALDEKQDVLTFDSVPTQNSNNPVKSGGVYAEVNSLEETLTKEVTTRATLGAHNLLKNNLTTQVLSSEVTLNVNDDGSVTVSGTPTSKRHAYFTNIALPKGNYILSGMSGVTNLLWEHIDLYDGDTLVKRFYIDSKNDYTFDTSSYTYTKAQVNIATDSNNVACSGTIYPMIRLVTDSDPTYQPYAKSNKELTDDTVSKLGILSTTSLVSTNALEFMQYGKVVAVNGYLTLNGNQTADGATSNELGTVSGIDLPNTNRAVRTLCGIAANAWDFPTEVGYITLTTAGSLQLKTHASGTQNVYFSFSYVVA